MIKSNMIKNIQFSKYDKKTYVNNRSSACFLICLNFYLSYIDKYLILYRQPGTLEHFAMKGRTNSLRAMKMWIIRSTICQNNTFECGFIQGTHEFTRWDLAGYIRIRETDIDWQVYFLNFFINIPIDFREIW